MVAGEASNQVWASCWAFFDIVWHFFFLLDRDKTHERGWTIGGSERQEVENGQFNITKVEGESGKCSSGGNPRRVVSSACFVGTWSENPTAKPRQEQQAMMNEGLHGAL